MSVFSFVGCSKNAQKVVPETRGKRGESCLARNDCETGLACLGNICAKNEFNVDVTAKQCVRSECKEDSDCCGDRATEAPAKCKDRNAICDAATRTIPGCVQTTCASDATCGGGKCNPGVCTLAGMTESGVMCATAADCKRDTCVASVCTVSGYACTVATQATDCLYYSYSPTCSTRLCNCTNPLYMPTDKICTDPDCEDICLLRCEDSLCVQDRSCKTDNDCVTAGLAKTCDGGRCVECTVDKDCDVKNDETCEKGVCHKPCEQNEECGLFEECQKGDCVYVGCQSDRECILAASRGAQTGNNNGSGGTSNGQLAVSGADDPRLYKCLPSEVGSKINTCKIPCENDGSCGQFQSCDKGFCKFVGCETDDECRAYLGIANQMTSDAKPYVTTATCEATPTTADSP